MPAMDRFTHTDVTDMATPKHMVCPNCDNNWLGYIVHEATCPTPDYRY